MVRTWKASKLARDTHILERAEVGIGKSMESKKASKGHSPTREVGIGESMESKKASKGYLHSGEGRGWDW